MTTCRTREEARAAGRRDGAQAPPLSQDQADYIAALLSSAAGVKARKS
jgi:hypothetical protein